MALTFDIFCIGSDAVFHDSERGDGSGRDRFPLLIQTLIYADLHLELESGD